MGYYWRGKPDGYESAKHKCRLIDIHALQIIQEHVIQKNTSNSNSTQTTSFHSYELNLVCKDGKRYNVLDHGEKHLLLQEAEKLSQFLGGKPVWNAIYF